MKVYSMKYADLEYWVKNTAEPGDLAYYYVNNGDFGEVMYTYYYTKPDDKPMWCIWSDMKKLQEYLYNLEEPTVSKRCENCKHFRSIEIKDTAMGSWCEHDEHKGMYVPKFVSCPEYEPKDARTTPFDGVKFYLIDDKTGELNIKYVCEDCGKIMDKPDHWWLKVPYGNAVPKDLGYHFRCAECDKKKEDKT